MTDPAQPAAQVQAFARKAELEAALAAAPESHEARTAYFEFLGALSSSNTGLFWVNLPELAAPLAARAGTPDLHELAKVFLNRALVFDSAATPRRILVLGAHAGYGAVDLARRFPRAEIAAVEPLPDNVRLLRMNTAPWPRITVVPVAAWHNRALLAPMGRFQADWSVRLSDEGLDAYRVLQAEPVAGILAGLGWSHADMVVCDTTYSEREIFNDRAQGWLAALDVLLVRLYNIGTPTGAEVVAAALPAETFEQRKLGEFDLFTRRTPHSAEPPLPAALHLLRGEPGLKPFRLSEVPQTSWGFFVFDSHSCQLHPSGTPGKPSRAIFGVTEPGYQRFVAGLSHAGIVNAYPVVFTVFVVRNDGTIAAQADATVTPQQTGRISLPLPAIEPPFHIVLQTEMVAGAQNHRLAWARWIGPRLV